VDVTLIPSRLLARLPLSEATLPHWNVVLSHSLLLAVGLVLSATAFDLDRIAHVCLFQALLDMPCPGCGVTRSALACLSGRFFDAWAYKPAGLLVCAAIALQGLLHLLAIAFAPARILAFRSARAGATLVTIALLANWLLSLVHH